MAGNNQAAMGGFVELSCSGQSADEDGCGALGDYIRRARTGAYVRGSGGRQPADEDGGTPSGDGTAHVRLWSVKLRANVKIGFTSGWKRRHVSNPSGS